MKSSMFAGRIWIALSTLIVVGLVFAYYFLLYIPDKEDSLINKKYRVLQRIGENFIEMKADYESSISLLLSDPQKNGLDQTQRIDKILDSMRLHYHALKREDFAKYQRTILTLREEKRKCTESLNESLKKLKVERTDSTALSSENRRNDKAYVFLNSRKYRIKLSDFITNPDLINNHFNRFLIVRLFKKKNKTGPDSITSVVAYQGTKFEGTPGAENKILLSQVENLFDSSQGFVTIPSHTIKISGEPHRLFPYVLEMESDEDWILCGLIKESEIRQTTHSIELFVIIMLVLLALFLLLAMPVLKLLIMSSIERLQLVNVWFMGYSIVIGTAMITVLFLVGHHYISYENDYKDRLTALSESVTTNFNTEITAIIKQMDALGQAGAYAVNAAQSNVQQYSYVLDTCIQKNSCDYFRYPFFNEFILMNKNGDVLVTLATHRLPYRTTRPNLSGRKYFTDARDSNLTSLISEPRTPPFAIQSIRSWNSGLHEAGVSIPVNEHACTLNQPEPEDAEIVVKATAAKLKSVMDPLLPPGFQFCVVGHDGEVLFHSEINKNLQENFLDEIEHNYLAEAAIEGRLSTHVTLNYSGKEYLAYIKPLDNKSLYLITLLDKEYYNTPVVLTVGFVWILITITFLIQGFLLLLMFAITYKSSRLRVKRFFMSWLKPHTIAVADDKTIADQSILKISFHECYTRCIVAMAAVSVGLIILSFATAARYLAVVFITLPVVLLTTYFVLFYKTYSTASTKRDRNRFLVVGVMVYVVITIFAIQHMPLPSAYNLVLLQAVILMVWIGTICTPVTRYVGIHTYFEKKITIDSAYLIFLYLWLFLVSILPVSFFYQVSFFHEHILWSKFLQWEAYQGTLDRKMRLQKDFERRDFVIAAAPNYTAQKMKYIREGDVYGNYLYCDGIITEYRAKKNDKLQDLRGGVIEEIEFRFRPPFYGPLENSRHILLEGQHAAQWYDRASRGDIVLKEDPEGIRYETQVFPFSFFKGYYTFFFGLAFLMVMVLIIRIVQLAVRYIYGRGLLNSEIGKDLDEATLVERMNGNENFKIFIVGLPFSGKTSLLKRLLAGVKVKEIFLRYELDQLPDVSGHNTFILHNFEHGINDQALNEKRLELMCDIQRVNPVKIIIASAMQPAIILDIMETRINRLVLEKRTEEKDKTAIQNELAALRNSYRVWKNILAGFEIQYQTLVHTNNTDFVEQELGIGNFLPKLVQYFRKKKDENTSSAPEVNDDKNNTGAPGIVTSEGALLKVITQNAELSRMEMEDVVLEIEERANAYYHSVWNSFSRAEKHMLFDLAKDRFVNMRDVSRIRLLVKKGVIVMDDAPRIMNKSFNNFILSVVKEDEELSMNNELRRKGTWHSVQLILIIALISITIFIALVQREMLTNINALVATISGVIALLLRFSGLFGSSKSNDTP